MLLPVIISKWLPKITEIINFTFIHIFIYFLNFFYKNKLLTIKSDITINLPLQTKNYNSFIIITNQK